MDRKQNALCKLHTLKTVQIGSCITCFSASPICETKGCIKHHLESQKLHNSYALKEIQKITDEFHSSNHKKRTLLKKLVIDYFNLFKSQVETLYHEVDHSMTNLRFQNFLMDPHERLLADRLVNKRYSDMTCADVARVIPKMLKCSSFQEKQFNHIKDFLIAERQNIPKIVSTMILNMPYFREDQSIVAVQKFSEISDELLSNVNKKLEALTFRPRKLRIKYSEDEGIEIERTQFDIKGQKFIKLLENSPYLKEIEVLQFYCLYSISDDRWNIREQDYQIDFMDAVLSLPFLSALTINTGYKADSITFIEEMVENKNIELKVYKKPWHF